MLWAKERLQESVSAVSKSRNRKTSLRAILPLMSFQIFHIWEWTRHVPVLSRVYQFTLNGWPRKSEEADLNPYFRRKDEFTIEDGCVLWGNRVIVPPQRRAQVIAELQETHPGISRMKALARSYIWWPNMDRELESAVKNCQQCQLQQKAPSEAPYTLRSGLVNPGRECT